MTILTTFAEKCRMSKILANNVRRICKEQGKQMKDLAAGMEIDPASLTRALNGCVNEDSIRTSG